MFEKIYVILIFFIPGFYLLIFGSDSETINAALTFLMFGSITYYIINNLHKRKVREFITKLL